MLDILITSYPFGVEGYQLQKTKIKVIGKMEVSIQEVLEYADLPSQLKTWVISEEIILGARSPLVFTQLVKENSELIGKTGRRLTIPVSSTVLSGMNISSDYVHDIDEPESTLDVTGFQTQDLSISYVNVDVTNLTYAAVELSDVLSEDQVDIDFVRRNLQEMGEAIAQYIEASIRDLFIAGAGLVHNCTTLDYDELVDLVTQHIKAQSALVDYMKGQGLLKKLPIDLKEQLENVFEFSEIMRKKNGEKGNEDKENKLE